MTWNNAENLCVSQGGHLIKIANDEDFIYVFNYTNRRKKHIWVYIIISKSNEILKKFNFLKKVGATTQITNVLFDFRWISDNTSMPQQSTYWDIG